MPKTPTKKPQPKTDTDRLKPLSYYPMAPEDALNKLFKADPKEVTKTLREQGIIKPKKDSKK